MSSPGSSDSYLEAAEAAWRWVLDQVRWQDGPWIPEAVPGGRAGDTGSVPDFRDGMHSGTGGLAHALAEIRLARPWSAEERDLADAIAERVRAAISTETEATYFDGLVSSIGVLVALGAPGVQAAVDRLADLATPDGWPQRVVGPPRFLPDARINDATLGTAGVLLGALWARRHGVASADRVAEHAAAVLVAEAEERPGGCTWLMVPARFRTEAPVDMPNYSHGVAGVAAALAAAGTDLGRADLVRVASSGAEHLVTLADAGNDGFVVPRRFPPLDDAEPVTYNWCHGPAGTSLLFLALDLAGVDEVAGAAPLAWQRRCLTSVRTSGLPARLRPGFWDNDGRCCGTAGVGDVLLDSWQLLGHAEDVELALRLADTLLERAVREGPHAYWRFVEHRATEPLLPPGVGWMQGAAGIAAFLFRAARVVDRGRTAPAVARMDTWWALPPGAGQAGQSSG